MEKTNRPRIAFLDNIRWAVIVMVVLMHACVTYGGLGSWYYKEGAQVGMAEVLAFSFYQILSQAFIMGLLFFIAATLAPAAYDRKGFGKFILGRIVRLGIPTLIYMLILHPLTVLIREAGLGERLSWSGAGQWWLDYARSGAFLKESGPLWFALALLAFSIAYALCRLVHDGFIRGDGRPSFHGPRSSRAIHIGAVLLIAAMALGSFLIRLVQPMGTSWYNMQLCYFVPYIACFCVGLWAARSDFLQWIPRAVGRTWLTLALAVGIPAWLLLLALGGALQGGPEPFQGGWHWQAAGFALWESFFCVAVSIGVLVLYRDRFDVRSKTTGLLSATSFGVYCFHAPVLVGVTMLMRTLSLFPLAKALIAAVIAWTLSVALAWLVRRIPVVGKLFM